MSLLERFHTTVDRICRPVLDIPHNTVTYTATQQRIRQVIRVFHLIGLVISLWLLLAAGRAWIAPGANEVPAGRLQLAIRCLVVGGCLLGQAALRHESYSLLLLNSLMVAIGAAALLAYCVFYLLTAEGMSTEQHWLWLNAHTRSLFQREYECCGLYTFNDSFAIQPCPTLATEPCGNHLPPTPPNRILPAVGIGCAASLLMIAMLSLLLQRSFQLKHQYTRLHQDLPL